jgi:hypothetical protein
VKGESVMRTIISLCIVCIFLMSITIAQNCANFGSKNLTGATNPKYSWYWDGQLNGLLIKKKSGTSVGALTDAEAIAAVRNTIGSAFSSWNSATNNMVSGGEYDPSNPVYPKVTIQILQMDGTSNEADFTAAYGNYSFLAWNDIRIEINIKPGTHNWTLDPTMIPDYNYNSYENLKTVLLHEIGHVFTGAGHGDTGTVMEANGNSFHKSYITGLTTCDINNAMRLYDPEHTIILFNSFGGNGAMLVKGKRDPYERPISVPMSGYNPHWRESDFPANLKAINNQTIIEGTKSYKRIFNMWKKANENYQAPNISVSINIDDNTYIADFSKEYNIDFKNNRSIFGSGGAIKVNNVQYNSPTVNFPVKQYLTVICEAVNEIINRVQFTFSYWTNTTNSDTLYGPSRTFTPTDHTTYIANFVSKVLPPENVYANGVAGENVVINWQEHPNTNVMQYQIWRAIKHGKTGQLEPPYQIGTVNRGTTNFTDYDFIVTNTFIDCLLHYDVRAVYQNAGVTLYSDPSYIAATFGTIGPAKKGVNTKSIASIERISVDIYPNPFNPSTSINYQLPLGTQYIVSLKIYDMIGREVTVLTDGIKGAGYYSVLFDASYLSSGIYFARFTASPGDGSESFTQVRKMLLTK